MKYSRIIEILSNIYSIGHEIDSNEKEKEFLTKINSDKKLKKILQKKHIKRGDVVHFEELGDYRTDGQYIYDGCSIIPLDHETDPYGMLPSQFRIEEFPHVHYFTKSMYYEGVVHIDGPNYYITLSRRAGYTGSFDSSITKQIKCDERYLYHVKHRYLPFEWIILSKIPTKKEFKKNLSGGIFDNSETYHDFNFAPEEHGIHPNVILYDYISLLF